MPIWRRVRQVIGSVAPGFSDRFNRTNAAAHDKLAAEGQLFVTQQVFPFLMFEGRAEEAMSFYVAQVANSRVLEIARYGAEGPGPEGSVKAATFTVGGQTIMCTDSFVKHAFTFTPASSLFVNCESEDEQQRLFAVLSEGGGVLMPLADYGFSRRFAWVNDRFGVSWQLNLP